MSRHTKATTPSADRTIGNDRLLGVEEVSKLTGLGSVTATKLMRETGCCFQVHRRVYVLENSLYDYFRRLEKEQCSTRTV